MHSTKTNGQQWSIRAEFTVSPHSNCIPEKNCLNSTIQDKSGIRLSYCWKSNDSNNNISTTTDHGSTGNNLCKPIEYQKGNLTFTSTPPCRLHPPATSGGNFEHHDSGYGSDLVSLTSLASGTSQSPININNRKCRSTCNIVLCSNLCDNTNHNSSSGKCEKTDSLPRQIPALQSLRRNTNFYGHDDSNYQYINNAKIKKLLPGESIFNDLGSQYTTTNISSLPPQIINSTGYKPYNRDVSIQTSDSLQDCSVTHLENYTKTKSKRIEKRNPSNHNCYKRGQFSSSTRGTGDKLQASCSKKHSLKKNWDTFGHTKDSSKKSRTIHIDVYCTDTDMELSETSSSSWENESTSTPQTVFESQNIYITHEKAKDDGLPFMLKKYPYIKTTNHITSVECDNSDTDDQTTTSYPSKIDSFSTINDFSSSMSSIMSWNSYSLLRCTNERDPISSFRGPLPNVGKSVFHRSNSIGKNKNNMDKHFLLDEHNIDVSKKQAVEEKIKNLCLEKTISQNCEKLALKGQNDSGQASILNKNGDIKKKTVKKNSREKQLAVYRNEIDSYKSSLSSPCIKNAEEISPHGRLTYKDPTSQAVLKVLPEQYTEQIASRFGQVINVFKKPGHHKGPTKNPDCCCDHCKRYFM